MQKRVPFLLFVLALIGLAPQGTAQCGDKLYTIGYDDLLRTVDPLTGFTTSMMQLVETNTQFATGTFHGMAVHPVTRQIFAIAWYNDPISGSSLSGRHLATVNPTAGTTTMVGLLGNTLTGRGTWMSDLTFDANGTLYGIIGDGGVGDPQTMYTIDTMTAQITPVAALSGPSGTILTGDDGEALAFHDQNGFLFRASGDSMLAGPTFEAIDVATGTVTNIPMSGFAYQQAMELLNVGGDNFLWTDINMEFGLITSAGVVRRLATLDHFPLGMAYLREPATAPFFRQYGFGCLTQAGGLPWMTGSGCPSPGQAMTIHYVNGVPNAFGLLLLGLGNATAPIPSATCPLQIFPFSPGAVSFVADPNGDTNFNINVPGGLSVPWDVFFQAGQVDGAGFTLSNPLQTRVQ